MPCGNGLTLSKRKHGVCVPGLGLFSGVLVALCCLEVWGSEPRGCSPCPLNCSCVLLPGPLQSCAVNCSNIGLEKAPAATDLPLATNVLDLSKNHISSLDTSLLDRLTGLRELYLQGNRINVLPRGVFCCGPLSVLDLSNNQITTVKERICDNLCNLTQIDLSSNPLECDCKLFRLVSWLQKKGVQVRRPGSMLCNRPSELQYHPLLNISQLTCGMNYVACLEDNSSGAGGRSELVIFSSSTPGNFSREQCTGVCLMSSHRYGGLGARRECLCSTNSEPNFISESHCSAACTNPRVMEECHWTLADDVFAVDFSVSVKALPPQSVHDQVGLSAASSISPLTLSWDFGDLSPRVNTSETEATKATHKYGLPGQYKVGVTAWIGHKEQVSAQSEVTVMLPPKLQLLCPSLAVANKSLEISLLSWGALGLNIDWKITRDSVEIAKASPHCPGGVVHNETSHCFQILPEKMNWTDARQQCLDRGGDLAMVRTDALRGLLALNVTQERGVWLGLSDVQSPGKLLWVNGSEAQEGEEGPPPRSALTRGNICIFLDQRGQTSSHSCNIKRACVCELKPQVRVPDAGVYIVGLAVFPTHSPLLCIQADQLLTPKPTSGGTEVLLFPTLTFIHAGRVSSLEVVTQELHTQVQVRFQTYRPHCHYPDHHLLLPGCEDVKTCAPVAVCVPNGTETKDPPSCPPLQQWCPFQQQCLSLSVPCSPSSCSNCSQAHRLPHKARRPRYMLQNEVVFTLPAGPSAHIQIQDQVEDLLVSPGDVFALQHDAGPGSLLRCQPASHSLWHQSVLAINQSEWFWLNNSRSYEEHEAGRIPDPELDIEALLVDGEGRWEAEVVCPVRVLYAGHSETQLQGKHLMTGLKEPGLYNLLVYSAEPSYPASDNCLLRVVPPLGLTIIHPTLQNGSIYLQPNDTHILLRVQSRYLTTATWSGTNHTVTFVPTCPSEFVSHPGLCQASSNTGSQADPSEPSQYAVLDLGPGLEGQERPMHLELEAHNNVTEASLSVAVHLEEALQGLMVQPHPTHRVLMESVVSYTASVAQGSNPTFKWTVDDKPYFTYYNTVLNVIYQHAAVYKLTVTAMNHVSTITQHFNVTVDRLVPMANLSVQGVPDVVPQGSIQTFTTSVLLDMSMTATFRWCFGDGGYKEFEYRPPYSASLQSPDYPNQILLSNNVTYVYSQPGIYPALVSVSNRYENISQTINMSVYSILNHVDIQTEPQLLLVGQVAQFEAHPLPSPYGIHYNWHLGDGSAPLQGRRVNHTYTHSGVFNICVLVNNTISSHTAYAVMFVFEKIENLTANTSSPSELHSPTIVWAHIISGNNVTWTFSMGDGSVHTVSEPYISHQYKSDGNYTVNVTASNAVSSAWIILPVHVFIFQIVHIEPAGCVHENTPINFLAFVTGNSSAHLYKWKFGDDNTIDVRHGNPQTSHTYATSGNYNLTLSISSGVSKATKDVLVCVEPALQNISFTHEKSHYAVEEEIWFQVRAEPNFNYSYEWDFGQGDNPVLAVGSGNVATKYTDPGHYIVTVTVFNNISSLNTSVKIEVQMPIGPIAILHNSTNHNNLTLREPYAFHTSSLATNVSYTWHFGDGIVHNGPSIVHTYNISGNYNVTLTAVNTVSSNQTILSVVVLAPIRNLTLNSSLINVPLNASVNFEAHMDEGDGVRYSWILCDHCSSIVGTNTMFYTFRSVGTFTIIVIAENDINTTQASILLFVQRELEGLYILPEDELSCIGPTERCYYATNRLLHLQAGLKEGTNMTFTWNLIREFEPHLSVYNITGKTVEVNFSSPGHCNISLRADNLLGHLTVDRTINFLEPVGMVSLKISQNPVALNSPIHISVLANKGSNLKYRWWINKDVLQWNMSFKTHSFDTAGLKSVEIEVFNEVSSYVLSETVRVQENITGLRFTINSTELTYISTGVINWLQGEVATGTNVTWTWTVDGQTETGNGISHTFLKPKHTVISLKASNDISEDVVSRDVVVQDMISGLVLKGQKCVPVGKEVEFTVMLAAGTDPDIVLSINGENILVMQPNQTHRHTFTKVDEYMVTVTAKNKVTTKRLKYNLHVQVMETVRSLSIVGCCPTAIPVGVKKTFVANILTGSDVRFLWTLDLHHSHKVTHMSKEVSYVPEEPGTLTIHLKAFNSLNEDYITRHIKVVNRLSGVVVYAAPRDTFINKTVTLMASLTPRQTPVQNCLWELGDGSAPVLADTTVGYIYKQPGHYLVRVNCSNEVSWVLGQVEVNITVLECEEPEVQVVQAPRLPIWRAQPTLVEANVNLKGCVRYGEQYLWQILAAPSCDNGNHNQVMSESSLPVPVIHIPEVDTRRLQLSLPKMSLPAGNYSLVFSLSYEGVPLRKAACLQLSVMAAKLMPIIEGGTYRVWSRSQDLQLSAEQSYDPNMDLDSQSLLHYHWECIGTSQGPEHCSTLNFGLGSSGPVLGISGVELEAGVEYTFKLTISKDGMAPESTTQTVLVQSGHIPMVYLECVSCKAQSFNEVSQNSKIYLKGTCTNCEGLHRGRWTAKKSQNESLVLDSSTTTTGSDGMHLVLRQGALPEGDSYIFTLHVTDSRLDGEGAASITLQRNMPPAGGECHLKAGGEAGVTYSIEDGEIWRIQTLVDRVQFNCSGFSDVGVSETPLLYSLLVTRCREEYCEDFCVYRGSSPEHAAFLPPGFSSTRHRVAVSITVEDHQGATNTALNKSLEVELPDHPLQYSSLPHWLSDLTDTKLKKLLEQGDSQRVRELSLALITVLNEYEQTRQRGSQAEHLYRVRVRSNITRALTSLDLTTVNDIQQTSAALAQCTAVNREFICEECQNSTLKKLESMLKILQTDTKQGTVTPTEIADNILNIMGDLIHQVSQSASQMYMPPAYVDAAPKPSHPIFSPIEDPGNSIFDPLPPSLEPHPLRVAAKAYNLSSVLMLILMHARVLNEEPLRLRGAEIAATGKLADPQSLLCYQGNNSPECQRFSIPRAFNKSLGKAAAGNSIMQLLFQVESNPFPFNYVPNYTVSTEVASMEFRTENGTQIPISGLDDSLAITVAVNNGSIVNEGGSFGWSAPGLPTAGSVNISHCDSVIVKVNARNTNRQAGLFVQLNFTSLEDTGHKDRDIDEGGPYIIAYLHSHDRPNEFNCTDKKHIALNMTRGQDLDHKKFTFFLSPESYDTTLEYFINVSTSCSSSARPVGVHLEVGVFASLCQYFNESDKQWRTDGMVPLAETNATRAVCRTRHLTAFAAGLFVPPNAISFKIPERYGAPSLVVLLMCVLGLLSYVVAAAILHKLDQIDLRRAGVVPLCGQEGLFKYEVQVKTGWSQGAGTTAHVGISLYGRESRSGHRHLDSRGAFTRNALDIFHIATDTSLGNVWKIRIWHDNKGLSPAWLLQYVLVKDLQTGSSYYFLVDDWLSVDSEKTGRKVEIEVEASEDATLRQLPRLLRTELERAVCESHLWVSLWERPPRSPFTRLQRATCCALLLQLILMANTLWYSIVIDKRISSRAVSTFSSLNGETVAAGIVGCLVVYPIYLLVFTLFRMSRSKCVTVEQVPPQVDQESVEIDDFLDNSMAGSSFLFFSGETNSEETNVDLPTPSTKSDESWDMGEEDMEDRDWPELMSEVSAVGGAGHGAGLPRLKRGQGSRHLGVDIAFNPDNEDGQPNKYFTSSDEDLIKHILADGQNFFPEADESEMADLSSIFGDKTEVILLQKLNEPLPLETVRRDPPKTAFTSNTVVTDVCRPRRFPPWCGRAALWGSWAGITLANVVSIWAGHGFSQKVAMMWLISCFSSVLCSCLLLEPIKVICEAAYYAVFVRRLRPEDQDVLVEFPRVERVVQRVHRVRPPQGFALSQARQQARKVHMLHTMLKNFLVYMFLLLVVILLNYSDSAKDTHSLRLRTQLQQALHMPEYQRITSREDVVMWLNGSLLPRLLDDSRLLQDTGSVLLGTVRFRQIRDVQEEINFLDDPSVTSPTIANRLRRFSKRRALESADVIHQLNRSLGEAISSLEHLQRQHWLNYRTRAVVVEFPLYNINTNLLAVFSFVFNFPVSERAQSSLNLLVTSVWPITGLDLPLLLTMILFVLIMYFLIRGILGYLKQGYTYLLSSWRLLGVCKLVLALSVCGLHISRCIMAKQQWTFYLRHQRITFTDFYPVAKQSQLYTVMSALLLFILVLKASHQLRFLREWAVFGRTLRRSGWELLSLTLALLLLVLAYAHTGHLLFHSVFDGYSTVSTACMSLLGTGGRGVLFWKPVSAMNAPSSSVSTLMFHTSFAVLRLLVVWFVIAVLLRNYRRARAELYRPAVDLQDYEMVELFLRRLKMWMGLSRAKEFRHKVHFEGMDLPPSRSSSTSDCRSLCLPPLDRPDSPSTPDSVDGGSEASWRPASSSPCSLTEAPGATLGLGFGLGLGLSPGVLVGGASWKEKAETEAALGRVLPTLDALLQQLDRVTMATEDLYYVECKLEKAQKKRRLREMSLGTTRLLRGQGEGRGRVRKNGKEKQKSKKGKKGEKSETKDTKKTPVATPLPFLKSKASSSHLTPNSLSKSTVITQDHTPPHFSGSTSAPVHTLSNKPTPAPVITPAPTTPGTSTCASTPTQSGLSSSSLFNHPAHTTTIPTHKRKRKPPPLKNKVHPNLDKS